MSSLQTDAKPRLLPKLRGDWHYMTRQDQAALSTWACMFTMVYERADPDYAAIDARERQRFCRYKAPSDEWRIWVGRGDDYLASQNLAIHRGMTEPGDVKPDAEKVAQITISAPGKFVFLTLYSRSDRLRHSFFDWSFDEAAKGAGLLRIWPPQSRPIFESPVPPNTISEPAMDALIERFTEIFRMQVAWL